MKTERCWCYDDRDQQFEYVAVEEAEKLEAKIERLQAVIKAQAAIVDWYEMHEMVHNGGRPIPDGLLGLERLLDEAKAKVGK